MNNSKYENIVKLEAFYDTVQAPPPFSHKYLISLDFGSQNLKIDLKLEYYDRDELSEDEIYDEGFSLDDDYAWKGELPLVWKKFIIDKLNSSNWRVSKKQQPSSAKLELKIYSPDSELPEILIPDQIWVWEMFLQEIIQSVFEVSKKEMPLSIHYLKIDPDNKTTHEVSMTFIFAERTVMLQRKENNEPSNPDKLGWKKGQKLMQHIFNYDFSDETILEKKPKSSGNYLDLGEGFWYKLVSEEDKKDLQLLINSLDELLD